jgi:hypothetical protein
MIRIPIFMVGTGENTFADPRVKPTFQICKPDNRVEFGNPIRFEKSIGSIRHYSQVCCDLCAACRVGDRHCATGTVFATHCMWIAYVSSPP